MCASYQSAFCCGCLITLLGTDMTEDILYLEEGVCCVCRQKKLVTTRRQARQLAQILTRLQKGVFALATEAERLDQALRLSEDLPKG